ncbi:hypothetical protein BO79DRAFT_82379 [Aspergillus costaricaensis CBS 115574]|uniref:Uncharacterized protein n=1 Tax=Aspergillus costaricaensis CBS 115574 TaxID=1448317 RepID=A0ACD1IK25_9EURO|nr:hypothetical protein BO79DRAFT_82379 [Aspergillus costaricaensis CBS 115574]RAK90940.1 hypothetical protein BO79DRAFT_82379 [Aspergillus costaricaensis CBS 115574]
MSASGKAPDHHALNLTHSCGWQSLVPFAAALVIPFLIKLLSAGKNWCWSFFGARASLLHIARVTRPPSWPKICLRRPKVRTFSIDFLFFKTFASTVYLLFVFCQLFRLLLFSLLR